MTMENVLTFATGPLFRFSLAIMALGTLRLLWTSFQGIIQSLRRDGDRPDISGALKDTFEWVFPVKTIIQTRPVFSIFSLLFHLGMIIVILFHQDHLLTLRRIITTLWPPIPRNITDLLTCASILSGIFLLGFRIFNRVAKNISGPADYATLGTVIASMLTGFVASRSWSPIPHDTAVLCHVLLGNLILIMLPLTKLSHAFLYPVIRIATLAAWRFPSRVKAVKQ